MQKKYWGCRTKIPKLYILGPEWRPCSSNGPLIGCVGPLRGPYSKPDNILTRCTNIEEGKEKR